MVAAPSEIIGRDAALLACDRLRGAAKEGEVPSVSLRHASGGNPSGAHGVLDGPPTAEHVLIWIRVH